MTLRLPPLPSLRDILRMYDLRARKQLSQNFLLDPRILRRMAGHVGKIERADTVLEVGPGPGGITRELIRRRPSRLAVVELDARFLPSLEALRSAASAIDVEMEVFRADILAFNAAPLLGEGKLHLVGNLPFNVSLPLMVRWLHDVAERRGAWTDGRLSPMTLTFQKEVGDRLTAGVWHAQRSRLSVLAQAYCRVEMVDILRGSAFVPAPKVDVAVVRLEPLPTPRFRVPFPIAERLIRHAFHGRQRQLVHCLETLFPPDRPDLVRQLFAEAGVFPDRRAVELSVEEVGELAEVYHAQCGREPDLLDFDYRAANNAKQWRRRGAVRREIGDVLTSASVHEEVMRQRMGEIIE